MSSLREEYREYRRALACEIRAYILAAVAEHPVGLAPYIADRFGMHRPYVYQELRRMVAEGILAVEGMTLRRRYTLLKMPAPQPSPAPQSRPLTPIERERLAWQNRKRRWRGD